MGISYYYLKARFATEKAAEDAVPQITEFLEQMAKAEEDWRKISQQDDQPVKERFNILKAKHPQVFERLKIPEPPAEELSSDVRMNFLSGELNSPASDPAWNLWQQCKLIGFHGEVWHFADWGRLARAMKTFGALRAAWVSDEQINPYEVIRV